MSCCKKPVEEGCGCGNNSFSNGAFIILILYILLAIILGGLIF